ncbi:MAG: DUF1318 domain-containing protein [Candidatus Hydrogenedentes bacterium]|nr:DUF1318 domain-containing protein [Candidatus Hydrogenedentota bacterium]
MKRILIATIIVAVVVVLGCTLRTEHTIDAHITVDIRHIEEQADNVLDFIEGESDKLPPVEPAETSGESFLIGPFLDAINPLRHAYAGELKSDSERIREIAKRLKERFPKIEALKKQGLIGENDRGYVELRSNDALEEDTERKNDIEKLIKEENEDRKKLYTEIVKLNTDQADLTLTVVERIYAKKRLERAKTGEIFRLPPPGKDFDEFKEVLKKKQVEGKVAPKKWIKITGVK